MGEYSKALPFYEKSLQIFEKIIPPNYSDLVLSYTNIGALQINMKEYSKALSYFEQILDILQHSLPPNHRDIQDVQTIIKTIKNKLSTNVLSS
jgi:tetratricopeptide (TPR) repeat protein